MNDNPGDRAYKQKSWKQCTLRKDLETVYMSIGLETFEPFEFPCNILPKITTEVTPTQTQLIPTALVCKLITITASIVVA